MIDNWKRLEDVDVDELMKFVKGLFQAGDMNRYNDKVEGGDAIKAMYATGRSKITCRPRHTSKKVSVARHTSS